MSEAILGIVGPLLTFVVTTCSAYFFVKGEQRSAVYFILLAIFIILARINNTLLHAL